MVRALFGKRRKTLRNSLRHFLGEEPDLPASFDGGRRPEDLPVEELAELSNALSRGRKA
jgi:16S rRNA A1518/A1519 N6-dimethyltransferase RsmA/KsgA/DIM1 with predicted DNA glycosylase/AP lyase activity